MGTKLLQFRVRNFRCFEHEQVFSFVATSDRRLANKNVHSLRIGRSRLRILKSSVVYGANASGKTTLFHALFNMVTAIAESHSKPSGKTYHFEPFALSEKAASEPVEMELCIILDGSRYDYGFKIFNGEVISEWLTGYSATKPINYFIRTAGIPIQFSDALKGRKKTIEDLLRKDSLFLSAAAMNGHEFIGRIANGITRGIAFVHNSSLKNLEQSVGRILLEKDEACQVVGVKSFVLDLLNEASAGIEDIEIAETTISDTGWKQLRSMIAPESIEKFDRDITERKSVNLTFVHRGKDGHTARFKVERESSGTRKLFAIALPIWVALAQGSAIVMDELDAQMHELMTRSVIELFCSEEYNEKGAQLIFNTHNSSFLSSELFRRDQIWFSEKDQGGAATIYALTDFKPRPDKSLAKGYIQGLYGAVPWRGRFSFGNLSRSEGVTDEQA